MCMYGVLGGRYKAMALGTAWYVEALNQKQRKHLDSLKDIGNKVENESQKKLARAEIRGYLTALNDADMVSDVQFRALYIYYTMDL